MHTPFKKICLHIAFGGLLLFVFAPQALAQISEEEAKQTQPPTLVELQNRERPKDFSDQAQRNCPSIFAKTLFVRLRFLMAPAPVYPAASFKSVRNWNSAHAIWTKCLIFHSSLSPRHLGF